MKPIITLAFLCLMAFSGCNSQKKVLNSWLGNSKQNLYLSWGPPDRITEDGSGGEILIYARHVYVPNLSMNFWDYKMMYAHSDGTIYYWRSQRQPVAPTQLDVRFLN